MTMKALAEGETRRKNARRGSTDNKRRLEVFRKGSRGGNADWGGCDSKLLQAVVVAITELGGAVTIGLSRNGGAYSLTLLLDDTRETLWFNGDADLDVELEAVRVTLDGL